jgi:CheY-like chemotaxis protein/HPt (histidine-containing phosphotransfer) domain-containing protein
MKGEVSPMAQMDIAALMAQLKQEFVDNCRDKIETVSRILEAIVSGAAKADDGVEFRRHIHSMKGMGGTFGFPAVTHIAHKLEDYLEMIEGLSADHVPAIQQYLDAIDRALDSDASPSNAEIQIILTGLPHFRKASVSGQKRLAITAMVAMPTGVWRKLVGKELASCGFGLSFADDGVSALRSALISPPDLVFTSMELPDMSGAELSTVFRSVKRTAKARFAIVTSYADLPTPEGVLVIHKSKDFAAGLAEAFMTWKLT